MVETMNKQGCVVSVGEVSAPFRVIDVDHPEAPVRRTARKCDYLFVAADRGRSGLVAAPLELKSSGLRPATVVPQLQAGARVAEVVVAGISPVQFLPVAVHGRKVHRHAVQELRKKRVRFRKGRYSIVTMHCGDNLAAVVEAGLRCYGLPPGDALGVRVQPRRPGGAVSELGNFSRRELRVLGCVSTIQPDEAGMGHQRSQRRTGPEQNAGGADGRIAPPRRRGEGAGMRAAGYSCDGPLPVRAVPCSVASLRAR